MKKKILVFGSFVADLMSRGPHLPSPGETVLCSLAWRRTRRAAM